MTQIVNNNTSIYLQLFEFSIINSLCFTKENWNIGINMQVLREVSVDDLLCISCVLLLYRCYLLLTGKYREAHVEY